MTVNKRILRTLRDSSNAGLSLIEVIVSVMIIMVVSTSVATLSVQAIASTASTERRQLAVTVASTALEAVSAQPEQVDPDTGVSGLYNGRYSTTVTNAFTANALVSGVSKTYPAWDPTAISSSVPDLPITQTVSQSGTTFTVSTLIGQCYQLIAGGDCKKVTGYATAPATEPSGYSVLIRIMVVVSWTAGRGCSPTACTYTVTTLDDPHSDLTWLVNG